MSISSSGWYLLSVTTDCTVSEAQIIWGVPNSEIKYVFKLETDTSTDPLDPVENNTKITNGDWEQVDISNDSLKLCSIAGYWVYIVYSSDDSVTIYERVENWMLLETDEERLIDDMSLWNITYETDLSGLFSPENYDTSNDNLQNALKAFTGNDSAIGGDISNWNTENVTTMANMFKGATDFDGNLSTWTTTNVADMSYMFYEATDFNSDISEWDVHNVTDMSYMFYGATSFTNGEESSDCCSKIGCKWNVYNVTNMSYMFYGATLFNLDIGNWSPESVTNFSYMFAGCTSFDQDLSSYSLTNAEYMEGMLDGCTSFNQDLSTWDVVTISSNDVSETETTNSDSVTFTLTMNYKNVVDDDDYELTLDDIDVYLKDLSDSSASFTSVSDTNALALDSNDSNGVYTLTLTHDSDYENLDYYIQVNVGVISNGNIMTDTSVDPVYYVSSKYEWTYDTRGTTVTISYDTNEITTNNDNGIDYSTNDTLTFTLTTNENTVKGDTSQIVCTNCTVIGYGDTWSDDIDDSNTTYELIVQPKGDGECTIVIQPGVLLNSDGNQNYEVEYSWTQDTSKPTVIINAYETDDDTNTEITSGSTTEVQTLYVYFTIADIDTTFSDSSITLTGSNGTLAIDTSSTVEDTSANTTTYKAVFQSDSNITTGDTFTVYVEAGVFTDPAGNSNETSNVFQWTYQNPSPTVEITATETGGTTISNYSSTEEQSIYVYFTVDDVGTSFDPTNHITYDSSALTLNYDSSDDVTDTSANTVKYTVTFTAVSVGTFNVSVDENAFEDEDGHGNEGSDVFQWNYGLTSPTVTITATDMSDNSIGGETYENEIIIKVELNEANTHFNESHISVSDGTILSQHGVSLDYINFTFKHTAYKNSTFAVYVNAGRFQHENDSNVTNVASNVFTWDYNGIIKFRSSVFRLFYYSTQDDTSSDKYYLTYNSGNEIKATIGIATNDSSNAAHFRLTRTTIVDRGGKLPGRYDYHIKLDNDKHELDEEGENIHVLRIIDFNTSKPYTSTNHLNLQIEQLSKDSHSDGTDGWAFIYITQEEAWDEGVNDTYNISNAILRYYHNNNNDHVWWGGVIQTTNLRGTTAIQHNGELTGDSYVGSPSLLPFADGTRILYMEKCDENIESSPST